MLLHRQRDYHQPFLKLPRFSGLCYFDNHQSKPKKIIFYARSFPHFWLFWAVGGKTIGSIPDKNIYYSDTQKNVKHLSSGKKKKKKKGKKEKERQSFL